MATLVNVIVIALAFFAYNGLFLSPATQPILTLGNVMPPAASAVVSWLGVLIMMSGMVFMIGGWYSLGECFSTDAEVLEGIVRQARWLPIGECVARSARCILIQSKPAQAEVAGIAQAKRSGYRLREAQSQRERRVHRRRWAVAPHADKVAMRSGQFFGLR